MMFNNTTTTITDFLWAMQQRNLVYNYNFLNYSNKIINTAITYNHPDGWVYKDAGSGGLIGFEPTANACLIKKSSGNALMTFTQALHEFPRWTSTLLGKRVTASASIKNPSGFACQVTFSLFDGQNTSSKSIFFNAGEQKEINLTLDISLAANQLIIAIQTTTSEVVLYISKVYANVGTVALENLPCIVEGTIGERRQYMSTEIPPAVELSLCNASAELSGSYTRLNSFLNGKFGKGQNGNSLLPDMRGYFSRAWNNGASIDTDANNRTALGQGTVTGDHVGTVEQDQFKEHTHGLQFDTSGQIPAGTANPLASINKMVSSNTNKTGGTETRGKNIAELYTIKWA